MSFLYRTCLSLFDATQDSKASGFCCISCDVFFKVLAASANGMCQIFDRCSAVTPMDLPAEIAPTSACARKALLSNNSHDVSFVVVLPRAIDKWDVVAWSIIAAANNLGSKARLTLASLARIESDGAWHLHHHHHRRP